MNADFLFRYDEPFVCTAIHNGHNVRKAVDKNFAVPEDVRFREEDPQTEFFAKICNNKIISHYSRFEFDLNRPREKAVYLKPEDAWGLTVRKEEPKTEVMEMVLASYDLFYRRVNKFYQEMVATFGNFFIYDIHSYNHQRSGPDKPFDDPERNPEIILGTSNMDKRWQPLIDSIEAKMREYDFFGREIDVRQNVKFPGGHFSRWTHNTFPNNACSVAIEFKKIFMDEWTGEFDWKVMEALREILASTKPVILDYLEQM